MKKYILVGLTLMLLFIAGCGGAIDVSKMSSEDLARISEKAVICNAPYIRLGAGCCLDQDSNSICDDDERDSFTPPPSTIPVGIY